jgi:polyisoprenyl-phosphate glycosyltransferase
MRVSVVVPVFNEEKTIGELLARIRSTLAAIGEGPHEIILVDDGSTDRTAEMLQREIEHDARLVGIVFSRNFGHQAALTAGLDHSAGDVTIVMDGDLQDPPEAIPLFLEKYDEGFDVVYAQRVHRKESWWLRLCYHLFYRLIGALSGVQLPLDAGDFGLMSARVVGQLRRMPEHHRYLRGLRAWVGFRQIGIPIPRAARFAGEPKYSAAKLLKLAFDGIFSFSIAPLRFAAISGALAMGISAVYAAYALYARFFQGHSPQGFTALIVVITFLAGVQLFFMGVIGEYLGRLFEASKQRPTYIVDRKLEHADRVSHHTSDQMMTGHLVGR